MALVSFVPAPMGYGCAAAWVMPQAHDLCLMGVRPQTSYIAQFAFWHDGGAHFWTAGLLLSKSGHIRPEIPDGRRIRADFGPKKGLKPVNLGRTLATRVQIWDTT